MDTWQSLLSPDTTTATTLEHSTTPTAGLTALQPMTWQVLIGLMATPTTTQTYLPYLLLPRLPTRQERAVWGGPMTTSGTPRSYQTSRIGPIYYVIATVPIRISTCFSKHKRWGSRGTALEMSLQCTIRRVSTICCEESSITLMKYVPRSLHLFLCLYIFNSFFRISNFEFLIFLFDFLIFDF